MFLFYIGTKFQRNLIEDYIDDVDMKIISAETVEEIEELETLRNKAIKVLQRGFGILLLETMQNQK